jgi:flagellar biosynthesis protein FlhB
MTARVIEGPFRIALCAVLLTVSAFYTWEALSFHPLAMYAPLAAGAIATVLMLFALVREGVRLIRARRSEVRVYGMSAEAIDDALTTRVLGVSLLYLGVMVAYVAATYVVGLVIASVVVLGLLLHFDARVSPRFTAISLVALLATFYVFGTFAELKFPEGLFEIGVFG